MSRYDNNPDLAVGRIKNPDVMDFAGDYSLSEIALINHQGEAIDIKLLVQELNIYESIYNNAVTGTVVITDAVNLINNLPIQGTERLAFKLKTPGTHDSRHLLDCTEETGHPMHIFKLTHRQQLKQGVNMYILHFASREFMRNMRTKVSKSYSGRIDTMVNSIMSDKEGIDSRKKVTVQKTRNSDKIVIPNKQPFDAIAMLCKKAMADNSKSVGYYFYETTKGFHFRSWESMCVTQGAFERPVKATFQYKPMNMEEPQSSGMGKGPSRTQQRTKQQPKVLEDYESVEFYEFVNNFHDVAANTVMGTYAHNVITHNIYDKSYNKSAWNYHLQFGETKHSEDKEDESADNKFQVSESPVDFDGNNISDYSDSRVSLQPTTQFLHNEDTGSYGTDVIDDGKLEGTRISQIYQVNAGTRLKLIIKGHSYLEAGDMIQFNLLSVESTNSNRFDFDPQYSGRYIVASIRHRVTDQEYKMIIECVKDSVKIPFKSIDTFPGTTDKEEPTFTNIYDKEGFNPNNR